MSKRLYVGNMAFHSTEDSVRGAFQKAGVEVLAVQLMTDRVTGQSRGFCFVDVAGDREAEAAIEALHGQELDGRTLTVNEARARTPSPGGFGGGGGGGGGRPRDGGGPRGGGGGGGGGRGGRGGPRGRGGNRGGGGGDRW